MGSFKALWLAVSEFIVSRYVERRTFVAQQGPRSLTIDRIFLRSLTSHTENQFRTATEKWFAAISV